ncbi:MAG: hypothetical protein CM15mV8_2200 [Caudoviricetes sp.]|nr:MAG: hypothetical protein CM15mV8_2200 [Caudoviricetes sp.]
MIILLVRLVQLQKVSNKDLLIDQRGNLRGSFFIDVPNVEGNQKFKTEQNYSD